MFKYTKALCRKIPRSIVNDGLRMEQEIEPLAYQDAVKAHAMYVETLKNLGLQVTVLEADEKQPDCVFVEDTAIVVGNTVLITLPGALSRQPEVKAVKDYFEKYETKNLVEMKGNARLDGGDVLFTGHELFVGLSERTNEEGFKTLRDAFSEYPSHMVNVSDGLHLKSFMSMLCDDMIACGKSNAAEKALLEILAKAKHKYSVFRVGEDEGANVLFINGVIVCRTKDEIPLSYRDYEKLSIKKVYVNGKELSKVDGCLTCSSLLYN